MFLYNPISNTLITKCKQKQTHNSIYADMAKLHPISSYVTLMGTPDWQTRASQSALYLICNRDAYANFNFYLIAPFPHFDFVLRGPRFCPTSTLSCGDPDSLRLLVTRCKQKQTHNLIYADMAELADAQD